MCNELEIYKKQLKSYKNLELSEKEFNPINVFFNFRIETEFTYIKDLKIREIEKRIYRHKEFCLECNRGVKENVQ